MTFIEMLQQGGYILPQYSSGQQTFQAPNSGMQTLQSMMAVDQAAQQRYVQGEQLNLQRSQNTQGMINSAIQNELNRKTQERLQQQMDLANSQLEFNMKKETIAQLDEDRVKMNQMFLSRDIPAIEKELADAGLDDAGILKQVGDMKGTQAFDATMKLQSARRAIMAKYKNGYTNKQTWSEGKKRVDAAAAQIDKAKFLFENNLINPKVYKQYWDDLQKSTDDLVRFENGNLQAIDFNSSQWTGIAGAPSFLDEAAYDAQVKSEAKLRDIEIQQKELNAQKTLADTKAAERLRPIKEQQEMLENFKLYGENAQIFGVFGKYNIPFSENIVEMHQKVEQLTGPEKLAFWDDYNAELRKQKERQASSSTAMPDIGKALTAAEEACAANSNSPECAKIPALREAYKFQNPDKGQTVSIDPISGKQYLGTDANRVYMQDGVVTDNNNNVKQANISLGNATGIFNAETTGDKKGKIKVTAKGKDYHLDTYKDPTDGKQYIKVTDPAFLEAAIGRAEKWGMGSNELHDYAEPDSGLVYIGTYGGKYDANMKAILIPTSPFTSSPVGGAVGDSGIDWTK